MPLSHLKIPPMPVQSHTFSQEIQTKILTVNRMNGLVLGYIAALLTLKVAGLA